MTRNLTEEAIDEFSRGEETAEAQRKSGAYLVGVTEPGESPAEARDHLEELRELVEDGHELANTALEAGKMGARLINRANLKG